MKLFRGVSLIRISVYLYLTIFLFLFCYTFYRAEFIHSGNQFSYYNKYYSIFIFGTLFWFVVLFLKKKRKLQIVVLSTSLIFILYFYETISFFAPSILKLNLIKSVYKEASIKAMDFILNHLTDKDGKLFKRIRIKSGTAGLDATIEDYSFLIWGAIELYQLTFDPSYLELASFLSDHTIDHFLDVIDGSFYFTSDYAEELLIRSKDVYGLIGELIKKNLSYQQIFLLLIF